MTTIVEIALADTFSAISDLQVRVERIVVPIRPPPALRPVSGIGIRVGIGR